MRQWGEVMKAQVTLTVPEAKALIAEVVAQLPEVKRALSEGKVLLKGGTTVAAVAKRLAGCDLRISGRISPRGAKATKGASPQPHSILIDKGAFQNIDECFGDAVASLRRDDIAVIGANALDGNGRAAMLLGRALGGMPGQGFAGLMSQGCQVIIVCGLEKLIPGPIDEAVRAAGIYSSHWSMGMAAGLAPLCGQVITEQKALETLAKVTCTVIGSGGIDGAEGATTMILDGEQAQVAKAVQTVLAVKGALHSGCSISLEECQTGSPGCGVHQSCAWRTEKGERLTWHVK